MTPVDSFLRYWLAWPSVQHVIETHAWVWPLCETFHFFGIVLLIGGVGLFDLRILGMAKALPIAAVRRLLPWGVFGFILCVVTGAIFVTGMRANVPTHPYDVIKTDEWLQLKFVFMALAGVNLLGFYVTGMSRAVDELRVGDDAPRLAKAIAGASLFLWLGVIYFGRLIPEGSDLRES
jgi:uncharacterized membrane protein